MKENALCLWIGEGDDVQELFHIFWVGLIAMKNKNNMQIQGVGAVNKAVLTDL